MCPIETVDQSAIILYQWEHARLPLVKVSWHLLTGEVKEGTVNIARLFSYCTFFDAVSIWQYQWEG